jgi:plastocyanin
MKHFPILLLLAAALALLSACAQLVAASPNASGEIEIVLDEYKFEPDVIRLKAGQTVHIKLRNEGEKMHEFMAGRDVQIHENLTEGFGVDFFAGITPEITGPGMVMGLEGGMEGMDMGGMDMSEDAASGDEEMHMDEAGQEEDEEMEMGGMGMDAEDVAEEMPEAAHEEGEHEEAAGDHAAEEGEAGHEEEGIIAGRFGPVQLPLMDAHSGLMVMIDPQMVPAGEATTITFTVPEDKVGTWQFGCFQERGQHYDDGMNGTLIVEP